MQAQKQSQKSMQKQPTVELACTKAYCCGCKLFKVPELSPSLYPLPKKLLRQARPLRSGCAYPIFNNMHSRCELGRGK